MAFDRAARLRRAWGNTRQPNFIRQIRPALRAQADRGPQHFFSVLLVAGIAAWHPVHADTFFVRTDGGDPVECTGRIDAPYPGSGTGQDCAWKHPFYALVPGGPVRIGSGDTLVIGSGSYMIGLGAPGAGACLAATCYMPAIPSGTIEAKTRIIGVGTSPPRLWGTAGVNRVLNLEGSSNVEIGNLELTDQDDCVYTHSEPVARCPAAGSGNWARFGLYARASSHVWLHDLDIHGLAHAGIQAGGLADWTMERMRIVANGRAGWDGNIGTGSSNSGNIVLREFEVGWNGCGERWQTGEPWACWAQQTGGYGDGLGTTYTAGHWLIEDAFFHHNTSDGLDLRFMDGTDGSDVVVRRTYAVANAGNQVKVRGNSIIENNVFNGTCGYFEGKYFMLHADSCRASGNTLQLVFTSNDVSTVRHNTITGEGGVLIGATEGDSSDRLLMQNNVLLGFPTFLDPTKLSAVFFANAAPAAVSWAGNLIWNVKAGTCPSGSLCGQNPKLANMTLYGFDAEPMLGSPVIDKVPPLVDVTSDFLLQPRPYGANSDIGAYELQFDSPCVHAEPGLSVTGPGTAVPAGTTVAYTVALRNNDSIACAATSFSLAESVPPGWTGTLGATSLNAAPGASASTTLNVTSASDASPGDYNIGTGVSSVVGAIHTSSASAHYAVATPAPVCTRAAPSMSLTGPSAAVPAGTSVDYTVSVGNNDSNACAATSFSLVTSVPSGWTGALAATTLNLAPGASATTTLSVTSANTALPGDYNFGAGISSAVGAIHTSSASAIYKVAVPAPVCVRAAPSMSLAGPNTAVPAGTSVDYTVSVGNNDSSACAATSFGLAASVPSGWSGALAATTLNLAPGATGSTTLRVTSAGNAPAAGYNIGAGVSSSVGAIHTVNVTASYTVAAPAIALQTQVATNKATYARGETVQITALLRNNGALVSGAVVTFAVTRPNTAATTTTATSGTDGTARTTYKVSKAKTASGQYTVRATWRLGGVTATATAAFAVL
jgi:hypothetical protein